MKTHHVPTLLGLIAIISCGPVDIDTWITTTGVDSGAVEEDATGSTTDGLGATGHAPGSSSNGADSTTTGGAAASSSSSSSEDSSSGATTVEPPTGCDGFVAADGQWHCVCDGHEVPPTPTPSVCMCGDEVIDPAACWCYTDECPECVEVGAACLCEGSGLPASMGFCETTCGFVDGVCFCDGAPATPEACAPCAAVGALCFCGDFPSPPEFCE